MEIKEKQATVAYVTKVKDKINHINLGVLIPKDNFKKYFNNDNITPEEIRKVIDITDGDLPTKKGEIRPYFCKGCYIVKLQVRPWTTLVTDDPIKQARIDDEELDIITSGDIIKFHAVTTTFTNNYGKFNPLSARAIYIYNNRDERIKTYDLDF